MRISAIDDDADFLRLFECCIRSVEETLHLKIDVSSFSHAPEPECVMKSELIFLDIAMPDINGFVYSQRLPSSCRIVFLSSHRELLTDSFMFRPYSFIDKKYMRRDLIKVIRRYCMEVNAAMHIRINRQERRLYISRIVHITVSRNTLTIHYGKEELRVKQSLSGFLRKYGRVLGEQFVRINAWELVNLLYVRRMPDSMFALAGSAEPLNITGRYKREFSEKYYNCAEEERQWNY